MLAIAHHKARLARRHLRLPPLRQKLLASDFMAIVEQFQGIYT